MNENTDIKNETPNRSKFSIPPALKFPQFRNFWLGMFAAVGGFQVLMFGQYWLIHELTGSPLYLGYVGVANSIPAILLNLIGGTTADRVDRRRLIFITDSLSASLVLLLGFLTLLNVVRIWHVLVIAVFAGAINAFNQPARQALFPNLVDRKALLSAVALNSAVWQGMRIFAPAVAGGIIAAFGTAASFFFAGAGMLFFASVVYRLKIPPMAIKKAGKTGSEVLQGLKFIIGNYIFSFLIGMMFFNSFFGMAYIPQMPVFSRDILNVGAGGQGMLLSISGIGSLLVTIYIGTMGDFRRKGLTLISGAALSGLSIAGFALSTKYIGSFNFACVLMFILGLFTSLYMISIMNLLQTLVPDDMRGRVMGFYSMTWNIMPLGGMFAGGLGILIGIPWAVATGGILVSLFALGPALLSVRIRKIEDYIEDWGS